MNTKLSWMDAMAFFSWLIPIIYVIAIFNTIPAVVPIHFGLDGKPNQFGSKNEFLTLQIVLSAIAVIVYIVLRFLPNIDPKKTAKYASTSFQKIGLATVLFVMAINICIVYAVLHNGLAINRLILPLIGIFFAFMGNIMYNIKPNYFAGIRTPWTLEDAETWKVTHRLAGKLWFIGGLSIAVLTLLLPSSISHLVFMLIAVTISIIPIVYSYVFYKKHQI